MERKPGLINYARGEWAFGGGRVGKVREVVTAMGEKETKLQVILIWRTIVKLVLTGHLGLLYSQYFQE